jgi:hypothetical protein
LWEFQLKNFSFDCSVCAGILAAILVPTVSQAATRIGGHTGFESVTIGSDFELSGFSLGALLQGEFLENSASAVLAGGRLNYVNVTGDKSSVDYKWSEFLIGAEVGLEYKATPQLFIQSVVGYDLGMGGTYEIKQAGVKREFDTKGIGRIIHDWRVLYQLNSNFILGANTSWFAGPVKWEEQTDSLSSRGFDLRAVAMYQF